MRKSAFTLIELLVTVSIIALLSGLVMINIYGNLSKGRDAKRKNDLRELKTSLDLYYNINNKYPPSGDGYGGFPPDFGSIYAAMKGCGTATSLSTCSWGSPWVQDEITFMGTLPEDPIGNRSYYYMRAQSGRLTYILIAKLERDFDPDIAKSQATCKDDSMQYLEGWYVVCDVK